MNASQILASYAQSSAPSSNVYDVIGSRLRYSLYSLTYPGVLSTSMYAMMVIFGFQAALLLISLALRAWDWQRLWLFRKVPDPKSDWSFITPHFAVSWQLCTLLFVLCLEGFAANTVLYTQARHRKNFILWQCLCWLPSWVSAWMAVWSLAVGQAVQARTRRAAAFNSPRLLNAIFILGTLMTIVGMIVTSVVSSRAYNKAIHAYQRVQIELQSLAELMPSDSAQQALETLEESVTPILQDHLDEYSVFLSLWRATWATWAGFTIYLYVIFGIVSYVYFASLRHSLARLNQESASLPESAFKRSQSLLHSAFVSSLAIAVCGGGAGLGWVVVSLLVAFQAPFPRGNWLIAEILLGCYGFALLGTAGALFSLERSFASLPSKKKRKLMRCCGLGESWYKKSSRGSSGPSTLDLPPVSMHVQVTLDPFGLDVAGQEQDDPGGRGNETACGGLDEKPPDECKHDLNTSVVIV